jgi:hypothetical protein
MFALVGTAPLANCWFNHSLFCAKGGNGTLQKKVVCRLPPLFIPGLSVRTSSQPAACPFPPDEKWQQPVVPCRVICIHYHTAMCSSVRLGTLRSRLHQKIRSPTRNDPESSFPPVPNLIREETPSEKNQKPPGLSAPRQLPSAFAGSWPGDPPHIFGFLKMRRKYSNKAAVRAKLDLAGLS